MMNSYMPFLEMALNQIEQIDEAKESFKERILKDWEETKNLPRKKKKAKRKNLNLQWQIANYEPFEGYNEGMDLIRKIF